jgi:hypothetical protein
VMVAGLAAMALVACASPSATSSGPEEPTADLTENVTVPPSVTGTAGTTRLRGTVSEGVERGCLLLTAPDGLYLLLGGRRAVLRPGAVVVVTGVVDRGAFTTCQQGTPFRVRSARPA